MKNFMSICWLAALGQYLSQDAYNHDASMTRFANREEPDRGRGLSESSLLRNPERQFSFGMAYMEPHLNFAAVANVDVDLMTAYYRSSQIDLCISQSNCRLQNH